MELFHFSEESDIKIFRPLKFESRINEPAMVWAIDEFHAPHYLFPRECPRVCIWPQVDTSESDLECFFGQSGTNRMMAIETTWLERLRTTRLYKYTFESEAFKIYEPNAGYYTATSTVKPVLVEPIEDLLGSIINTGIELRITPTLIPLKNAILASTVNFSMIRMRNAALLEGAER